MSRPRVGPGFVGDGLWVAYTNAGFSFALGVASVAVPLQAIAAGYSAVEVGLLVATSAVSQMLGRAMLGRVMRRVPDWEIIAAACGFLALSCALIVVSSAPVPFVVAQLLQGLARACFWTGSQTHVVRGEGSSVRALASVNLVGNVGLLAGPVVAGVLIGGHDAGPALVVAAAAALLTVWPTSRLHRLPPFKKLSDRRPGLIWRRPGVWEGSHAGITAGAWRGLLGSYVPLVLVHAGQSALTVGVLVAVANASSILGAWVVRRLEEESSIRRTLLAGTPVTGLAVAATGPLAFSGSLSAVALAVSGVAAGALQTLGPAFAADAVHHEERGEAIAASGTFRAAALFIAPLATAGLVAAMPIGVAMLVTGALIALPVGRWGQPAADAAPGSS